MAEREEDDDNQKKTDELDDRFYRKSFKRKLSDLSKEFDSQRAKRTKPNPVQSSEGFLYTPAQLRTACSSAWRNEIVGFTTATSFSRGKATFKERVFCALINIFNSNPFCLQFETQQVASLKTGLFDYIAAESRTVYETTAVSAENQEGMTGIVIGFNELPQLRDEWLAQGRFDISRWHVEEDTGRLMGSGLPLFDSILLSIYFIELVKNAILESFDNVPDRLALLVNKFPQMRTLAAVADSAAYVMRSVKEWPVDMWKSCVQPVASRFNVSADYSGEIGNLLTPFEIASQGFTQASLERLMEPTGEISTLLAALMYARIAARNLLLYSIPKTLGELLHTRSAELAANRQMLFNTYKVGLFEDPLGVLSMADIDVGYIKEFEGIYGTLSSTTRAGYITSLSKTAHAQGLEAEYAFDRHTAIPEMWIPWDRNDFYDALREGVIPRGQKKLAQLAVVIPLDRFDSTQTLQTVWEQGRNSLPSVLSALVITDYIERQYIRAQLEVQKSELAGEEATLTEVDTSKTKDLPFVPVTGNQFFKEVAAGYATVAELNTSFQMAILRANFVRNNPGKPVPTHLVDQTQDVVATLWNVMVDFTQRIQTLSDAMTWTTETGISVPPDLAIWRNCKALLGEIQTLIDQIALPTNLSTLVYYFDVYAAAIQQMQFMIACIANLVEQVGVSFKWISARWANAKPTVFWREVEAATSSTWSYGSEFHYATPAVRELKEDCEVVLRAAGHLLAPLREIRADLDQVTAQKENPVWVLWIVPEFTQCVIELRSQVWKRLQSRIAPKAPQQTWVDRAWNFLLRQKAEDVMEVDIHEDYDPERKQERRFTPEVMGRMTEALRRLKNAANDRLYQLPPAERRKFLQQEEERRRQQQQQQQQRSGNAAGTAPRGPRADPPDPNVERLMQIRRKLTAAGITVPPNSAEIIWQSKKNLVSTVAMVFGIMATESIPRATRRVPLDLIESTAGIGVERETLATFALTNNRLTTMARQFAELYGGALEQKLYDEQRTDGISASTNASYATLCTVLFATRTLEFAGLATAVYADPITTASALIYGATGTTILMGATGMYLWYQSNMVRNSPLSYVMWQSLTAPIFNVVPAISSLVDICELLPNIAFFMERNVFFLLNNTGAKGVVGFVPKAINTVLNTLMSAGPSSWTMWWEAIPTTGMKTLQNLVFPTAFGGLLIGAISTYVEYEKKKRVTLQQFLLAFTVEPLRFAVRTIFNGMAARYFGDKPINPGKRMRKMKRVVERALANMKENITEEWEEEIPGPPDRTLAIWMEDPHTVTVLADIITSTRDLIVPLFLFYAFFFGRMLF